MYRAGVPCGSVLGSLSATQDTRIQFSDAYTTATLEATNVWTQSGLWILSQWPKVGMEVSKMIANCYHEICIDQLI
ncbi:hypothetical protein Y1Q_0009798 [Alligator mississippiensis]|uniref:Uncharacterized protein n=1 Tax=Alligator mississippiensis TaxID=8496 RepID=A0A151MWU9_ALLMI|nr:hypothetical protein Y1Q_0009798 [Alligator mississippiensis]